MLSIIVNGITWLVGCNNTLKIKNNSNDEVTVELTPEPYQNPIIKCGIFKWFDLQFAENKETKVRQLFKIGANSEINKKVKTCRVRISTYVSKPKIEIGILKCCNEVMPVIANEYICTKIRGTYVIEKESVKNSISKEEIEDINSFDFCMA